jgi:hypothetical protein
MATIGIIVVAIGLFAFFVPVVLTTIPPPSYNPLCTHCAPYIAEQIYGSATYRFLGYGGIIPGDWGNWQYYNVYLG